MMDFARITPYVVASNFVLTWGIGFYVHLVNKNKATNDRIERMESEFQQRLARLESHHANAPTHADIAKVYDKLNRVAESSSRMEGQLDGIDATQRLILNRITEKGMA